MEMALPFFYRDEGKKKRQKVKEKYSHFQPGAKTFLHRKDIRRNRLILEIPKYIYGGSSLYGCMGSPRRYGWPR